MRNNNVLRRLAILSCATSLVFGSSVLATASNTAIVVSNQNSTDLSIVQEDIRDMALYVNNADFQSYAYKMSLAESSKSQLYYNNYNYYNAFVYGKIDASKYFTPISESEYSDAVKTYTLKANCGVVDNNFYTTTTTISPASIIINLTKVADNDYRVLGEAVDTEAEGYDFDATTMVQLNDNPLTVYTYSKQYDGTNASFIEDMNKVDPNISYVVGTDGNIYQTISMKDAVTVNSVNDNYFIASENTVQVDDKYLDNSATIGNIYKWNVTDVQSLDMVKHKLNLEVINVKNNEEQLKLQYNVVTNPIHAEFINKALNKTLVTDAVNFGYVDYIDIIGQLKTATKINFTTDTINKMTNNVIVLHFDTKTLKWEQITDAKLETNLDGTKYISGTFTSLSPIIVYEVQNSSAINTNVSVETKTEATKEDITTAPKTGEGFLFF